MPQPILSLLEQRDKLEQAARELVIPRWLVLQEELGVPLDLMSAGGPTKLDTEGERIVFRVDTRVPSRSWEKERQAVRLVSVPSVIFDATTEEIRKIMRTEFPLICNTCGIFHRPGTRRCDSPAKCWGFLRWRAEAPRPLFYVESSGAYGYFDNPAPRKLRYAIDLRDYSIFGVQITLRNREEWFDPIKETLRDIVSRVAESIAPDLADAINGRVTEGADPACLSLDPPSWCNQWAHRTVLEVYGRGRNCRAS